MNPDLLTSRQRADWLRSVDPGLVRARCGVSFRAIARACGVAGPAVVYRWETGSTVPQGAAGAAYCRIIRGLANHLEVLEEGGTA